MIDKLTIIVSGEPSQSECNFGKIAGFMGVPVQERQLDEISPNEVLTCVALSAQTLVDTWGKADANPIRNAPRSFVFGFDGSADQEKVLGQFTGGTVKSVEVAESGAYHMQSGTRDFCRQFTGLNVESTNQENDKVFTLEEGGASRSLIMIEDRPFLVQIDTCDREIFLVGNSEIADLDAPVKIDDRPLHQFSKLMPAMMFLRYVFGDQCWHNPKPYGCFIIDDPWLRRKYGFVDYEKLSTVLRQTGASASIAFIPWNYRRSRKAVVRHFSSNSDSLTLSVHGCDHNEGEFGITDEDVLDQKVQTALNRMNNHEQLTGLGFDPVMVFPQGKYSVAALKSLDKHSFLAAVNSDRFPTDWDGEGIPLRHFLDISMSHFEGVPLYYRNYPFAIADFAFDLFLGKPLLAVEHHQYFKEGYAEIEKFVRDMQSLDDQLEWLSLGDVIRKTFLLRKTNSGSEVRMFSNECVIENPLPNEVRLKAKKSVSGLREVKSVEVNGAAVDYELNGKWITFELSIGAGNNAKIDIIHEPVILDNPRYKPGYIERSKNTARRYLCDFRDNYLARNDIALGFAKSAKRRLYNTRPAN